MRQAHRAMISHRMHTLKAHDGAVLVEFAFALPVLALILVIIIDGGLAIREHQLLQNAAREGARFGSLRSETTESEITNRVVNYCAEEGIPVDSAEVTVVKELQFPVEGGTLIARGTLVTVTRTHQMLLLGAPLLPSGSITLTGRSLFRNLY